MSLLSDVRLFFETTYFRLFHHVNVSVRTHWLHDVVGTVKKRSTFCVRTLFFLGSLREWRTPAWLPAEHELVFHEGLCRFKDDTRTHL